MNLNNYSTKPMVTPASLNKRDLLFSKSGMLVPRHCNRAMKDVASDGEVNF